MRNNVLFQNANFQADATRRDETLWITFLMSPDRVRKLHDREPIASQNVGF